MKMSKWTLNEIEGTNEEEEVEIERERERKKTASRITMKQSVG